MLQVNEYFNGNVKSIGYENKNGVATVGVMAVGSYEFGTSKQEIMTVTSGTLLVKLPGEIEFTEYKENQTFTVDANQKFQVEAIEETVYICLYK